MSDIHRGCRPFSILHLYKPYLATILLTWRTDSEVEPVAALGRAFDEEFIEVLALLFFILIGRKE